MIFAFTSSTPTPAYTIFWALRGPTPDTFNSFQNNSSAEMDKNPNNSRPSSRITSCVNKSMRSPSVRATRSGTETLYPMPLFSTIANASPRCVTVPERVMIIDGRPWLKIFPRGLEARHRGRRHGKRRLRIGNRRTAGPAQRSCSRQMHRRSGPIYRARQPKYPERAVRTDEKGY